MPTCEEIFRQLEGSVLILGDADPDGEISALMSYKMLSERDLDLDVRLTRRRLTPATVRLFEAKGYDHILGLDFWPIYDSPDGQRELDRSELKVSIIDHHPTSREIRCEKLKLFNPYLKKERSPINTTQILYDYFGDESLTDLAAIGSVADYCTEGCQATIRKVAYRYPHILPELRLKFELGERVSQSDALRSKLGLAVTLFWAPFNRGGAREATRFVKMACEHEWTLEDILNPNSNPAVRELHTAHREIEGEIASKISQFEKRATFYPTLRTAFYTIHTDYRISSLLANRLSDLYPHLIIVVGYESNISSPEFEKTVVEEAQLISDPRLRRKYVYERLNRDWRGYSLRTGLPIDLRDVVRGWGGGHRAAVGARVKKAEDGLFRKVIRQRIARQLKRPNKPV